MTDNEIIKALECCEKLNHNEWSENMKICKEECPYKANCYDEEKNINMISDTLDLINRQQAEIERLNSCVKSEDEIRVIMKAQMTPMVKEITNEQIDIANNLGRISGILEFAERFNCIIDSLLEKYSIANFDEFKVVCQILRGLKNENNNLVKEMVGDTE